MADEDESSGLSPIPGSSAAAINAVETLDQSLIVDSFYEYPTLLPDPGKTLNETVVESERWVCIRNQKKPPSWDTLIAHSLPEQRTTEAAVIFSQKADADEAEAGHGNALVLANVD